MSTISLQKSDLILSTGKRRLKPILSHNKLKINNTIVKSTRYNFRVFHKSLSKGDLSVALFQGNDVDLVRNLDLYQERDIWINFLLKGKLKNDIIKGKDYGLGINKKKGNDINLPKLNSLTIDGILESEKKLNQNKKEAQKNLAYSQLEMELCSELKKLRQNYKEKKDAKDNIYKTTRKLDSSIEFEGLRMRLNVSMANEVPLFTLRIIKNTLPSFEELGVPDVIRRMMYQPQGLMLVTGKTNSGKSTTLNALINDVNLNQNKKILTLESPIEFKHTSKKSLIVQKEVGEGQDILSYRDGVINCLREDCDILVVGEIRDRETMEAAIDTAESGHLVIGTLHTKSCAETIDRMINFYDIKDQQTVKVLIASILKLVASQRLIKGKDNNIILLPEVMVVDNIIAGLIRKEKFSVSEIEDAIQSSQNGSIGFIYSIAQLFVDDKITLEQAKAQIEEKNVEVLNRTIMQLKIKRGVM